MNARPLRQVTPEEIATFERDGAVQLEGMFGLEWLELLAAGIDAAMGSADRYTRTQSAPDDPGRFFSDYWASDRVPDLARFVRASPAAEIAGRIMRSSRANFFFDAVWVKEPGTAKRSDWHQDQPYYCVDGRQVCIMWLPVDPVPRDVSLRCVKGSHAWGRMFEPVYFKTGTDLKRADAGHYEPLPDVESGHHELLAWDFEPGDVLVFHGMTIHGAPGNASRTRRRVVSTTWVGDDTRYVVRPGEMEPHRPEWRLSAGDVLDGAEFPRVWSA